MRTITSDELKQRLRSSAEHAILDVRREGDFAKGHLFFASNIPRSHLELRIEQLVPRRTTPITLVAKSSADAADAAKVLSEFGYEDVATLASGLDGWMAKGGQLFSGINVPSKAFGEFVEHAAKTPHIGPEALKHLLDGREKVVVFDARPFAEYQLMSIPGAINCPGGELVSRIADNLPSSDSVVVVNCAGRTRSIMGAQSLIDAGIPQRVLALRDGTMGWQLAGYDLEHAQTRRARRALPAGLDETRARVSDLARKAGVRFIDSADVTVMKASDSHTTYVFDVRDPEEYVEGHRRDVVSAPGGQLLQTLDTFIAVQNARILVTDSDATCAPIIGAWLRQMGRNDVCCAIDTDRESVDPPAPTPMLQSILSRARKISAHDASERTKSKAAVVADLANSKEYRRGHIPQAQFSERDQLRDLLSQPVILTSPDGQLAAVAAAELATLDQRVCALDGGTSSWKDAGYPLEDGKGNLPDAPDDVFYRPYDRTDDRDRAMRAYLDWEKDLLARLDQEPGVSFWRVEP